ncbi:MAG: hypothetical protein CMJ25_10380 [Phycisphaerae bacterium]|nr:hypothetical protein [Phycisphaerae bacterium]|tara:strand:+ start:7222 stop:7536 length:315 start_codon:yes stop_codon:yes gene_type:complete
MEDELLKGLNIVKAKEKIEVAGVVTLLIRDLKLLCEGYDSVGSFIRPCTGEEVEFELDYDPDENITDEVRNEMNKQEFIFSLTKSLFHYMDIVKDDEITELNGR